MNYNICSPTIKSFSCDKPNKTLLNVITLPQITIKSTELIEKVATYISMLGFNVEINSKTPLETYPVDIYVPDKNLIIECYDLNWLHDGKQDHFDKSFPRKKLQRSRAKQIKLMQFFSDELTSKWDICASMITNALGANTIKLSARDCTLIEVESQVSKKFVDENHISGSTRSKRHIGLQHPEYGLVAIATTRTPIQKKHGSVCELARMCFLRGISIRGGASKLLEHIKQLAKEDGYSGLLSYAELRFGNGNVYTKCGLTLEGESTNNYWYTDGSRRFDRFKFRAQPGKSEKIVAEENNVRSVWGAGNCIYLTKF